MDTAIYSSQSRALLLSLAEALQKYHTGTGLPLLGLSSHRALRLFGLDQACFENFIDIQLLLGQGRLPGAVLGSNN